MKEIVVTNPIQERFRCRIASGLLILSLVLAGLAEAGDEHAGKVSSAPHLDFQPVRASGLHLGMDAEEVLHIMGEGAQRNSVHEGDEQVFSFPSEPIPTKVVLERNKVTSVSLDIARLDDARLPAFSRKALVGMSSMAVRDLLGAATELRHYELFGTKLDQQVFVRPNEPVTSIFFVDDRVIAKTLGSSVPADILGVVVPAAPDPSARRTGMDGAVIGASTNDMEVLFGKPDFVVEYSFNRQRAMHAIYQTRDRHTLSVYFVGDAVTEITDSGMWSMEDMSGG